VYILDAHRQPVPLGVTGEIYVGGAGVSRGYLNRRDLTAERFVPDTFGANSSSTLYRSGDLARYLPNKDIEYLGRIDQQVKIRGFRIELGEIESALRSHEAVKECLVVPHEDRSRNKTIVAYFESRMEPVPSANELRAYLKRKLPDYMIPFAFMPLEKFSLTPNGKIDRKALPSPDEARIDSEVGYVPPHDSIEQTLAQLWSTVLKVKRVGMEDNFFDLGGHSILAVRIIVEIEKLYGRRLPLATLIQTPTIRGFAAILRKEKWAPLWSSLVPIRGGGSRRPLFLFHSHGGNILEYYPLADLLDAAQPVYGIQARGMDGNCPVGLSMEDMVKSYVEEIRTLQPQGPYYLAGFCFGGLAALEAARQLSEAGETVAMVGMIQTTSPTAQAFPPAMWAIGRWWNRTSKRLQLEWENFLVRGGGHLKERIRRAVDVVGARTIMACDRLRGKSGGDNRSRSMAYILERLGIEHDRAYEQYTPHPYAGQVILFRTHHQLAGFREDPSLGWKDLLGANLVVCEVPGHQQNVLRAPHVEVLAKELMGHLNRSQALWAEKVLYPLSA
jgi:thioesterase domain-containing protein/acyl carrier protein